MRRLLLLPVLAAAALVAACPAFDENGRYACTADADCRAAEGERCVEGACAVPEEPCGNGRCDPEECTACPADCVFADCSEGGCNSDGSCDPDETCFTCAQDCVEVICGRCGDEGSCEPTECELGCGECIGDPVCQLMEDCLSPGDEDGDELEQCADPDCAFFCTGGEDCTAAGDDDGDGYFDCADPDCFDDPSCACGDSVCDAPAECGRCAECDGLGACAPGPENCSNSADDDGDRLEDCADPDCAWACGSETSCGTGADNDGDGWFGCEDLDCITDVECLSQPAEDCTNGHDDDGDTTGGDPAADCQDTSCAPYPGCELSCGSAPVQTALPVGGDPSAPLLRLLATGRGSDLSIDCNGTLAANAFVLAWQAPADATYRFHTRGSSARSILLVGDANACPTQLACGVSPEDGTLSEATLDLSSGDQLLILLAPLNATDNTQLWLWVEQL